MTDPDESIPRTPRWVKAFALVAVVLVALLAVSLLTGGSHGPGRHVPTSAPGHR